MASGPGIVEGPRYPPREYLGSAARGHRLLQQLHHQLARQPDRGRRRHAQHPRAAEHVHQPRVARVLQPAGAGRPGILDSQHRVSHPRRVHAAHQRVVRRALLQQHDPGRDAGGGRVQRPLAQQPDAGRERGAGDLQRHHDDALHIVRPQRVPAQSRRGRGVPLERARGETPARTSRRPATTPRWRAGSSRRWPNTAAPRDKTATACWWTTTSS